MGKQQAIYSWRYCTLVALGLTILSKVDPSHIWQTVWAVASIGTSLFGIYLFIRGQS